MRCALRCFYAMSICFVGGCQSQLPIPLSTTINLLGMRSVSAIDLSVADSCGAVTLVRGAATDFSSTCACHNSAFHCSAKAIGA